MRDKFWSFYEELVDSGYYYWHYRARATFWDKATNSLTCIASAAGIATWIIWKQYEWIWAIIVGAAQVVNSIRHLFPFSRQISSVSLFLPELKKIINEVDRDWSLVDSGKLGDNEINFLIFDYRSKVLSLENKYITDTSFPRKRRCLVKATADRKNYFFQRYGITDTIKREEKKHAIWRKKDSAKSAPTNTTPT